MSELPNGWIEARFGQLFDFKGGSQPPKATFSDHQKAGYVRLLQIRDFDSDAKAVFIKDHPRWPKCSTEDIMIGRYGASVGRILTGKAGAYNVALVKMLFDRELVDASWVRLFLLSDNFQKPLKRISRSAQNGFNKADLEKITVPLAPLFEQRRIVAKFDTLSSKSKRARDHLDHIPG
jgi:type I restriction enzyme S subunit